MTGAVTRPWLKKLPQAPPPDLTLSSPDGTLDAITPLLEQVVGFDLETGADLRVLKAAINPDIFDGDADTPQGATMLVVAAEPGRLQPQLEAFAVVELASAFPLDRSPAALVGLHGFATRSGQPDSSFTIQMIDDWGIDDVMASAFDLASRRGLPLAVLFDLAVLDPVFGGERGTPGGLDMRRLLRAARAAGRRHDVLAAGFARSGPDINLVYTMLSFCAGLANR